MIALEVSSAAGPPPLGGVGGAIRGVVTALLRLDPETRYALCYRLSRWRKGGLFRPAAPNASLRLIQDPLNAWVLPRARLFHAMGVFVPRTPRCPKLVTIHDLNAVRNRDWVRPEWHEHRGGRIRDAVMRTDHVVTYSRFTAREVCEEYGLPAARVHPVWLGVDVEAYHPAAPEVAAGLRALHGDYAISIGMLTARKNLARLVRAVAPLEKLNLVLVGRDSDATPEVERVIDECGMRERTVRRTNVSHRELVDLLGSARVCVVPSLYEGFGLTPLEAMACGTPVVCSRAASLPEAAGDAALLVDASSEEELGDAIRRVVDDSALADELRSRGRARSRQMSWERAARELRALYERVA